MVYKVLGGATLVLALLVAGAWNFQTTIVVERTFNAPEGEVWSMWTDAKSVQRWWGPKGYTAQVVRNEVREGGTYLWAMRSERGQVFWSTGTYREVAANKRIVSTMSFANANGTRIPGSLVPVPGRWPDELTVIVDFEDVGGKTRVTVREVGIPVIVYPLSKIGWAQQFDKIQLLL